MRHDTLEEFARSGEFRGENLGARSRTRYRRVIFVMLIAKIRCEARTARAKDSPQTSE